MTTAQLASALARRWRVVLLGLAITMAACLGVAQLPGVYWMRVTVVLLPPEAEFRPNIIEDSEAALAMIASLVALDVNGGPDGPRFASPDAPLYGEGRMEASRVRVRDTGGQWMSSISHPYLDLEVVSGTADGVEREVERLRGALAASLDRLQDDQRVSPQMRATLNYSPDTTGIVHIRPARSRALAATALAGAATTVGLVALLERTAASRRRA